MPARVVESGPVDDDLRRSAASLHDRADGLGAVARPAPGPLDDDPRHGAARRTDAARMPVRAALPVRRRALRRAIRRRWSSIKPGHSARCWYAPLEQHRGLAHERSRACDDIILEGTRPGEAFRRPRLARRRRRVVRAVDGVSLAVRARRDLRHRRRIRLRKVDAWAAAAAPHRADRRRRALRGPLDPQARPERNATAAARDADHLPGPLRLAQSRA